MVGGGGLVGASGPVEVDALSARRGAQVVPARGPLAPLLLDPVGLAGAIHSETRGLS